MGVTQKRIGILGGGQLGKMLIQEGSKLDLDLYVLDADKASCQKTSPRFVIGDFRDEHDVYEFGRHMDVVTIEIEQVSLDGLQRLKDHGIPVYPDMSRLEIIADKALQKEFYAKNNIPTSGFQRVEDDNELEYLLQDGLLNYPFVIKARQGGYDGRGVQIVKSEDELRYLKDFPAIIEEKVKIVKEISVQVVRSTLGEMAVYPPVEMVFDPAANLLSYQLCPADLDPAIKEEAKRLALRVSEAFQTVGMLSVEMFYDESGRLLVNEVAPRVHNSGHHTLDNGATSQFLNHLLAVSGLPLGRTEGCPSIMINLLGEPGHSGPAKYSGLDEVLNIPGAHLHLYGKDQTRPYRKMGHVTIVGEAIEELLPYVQTVQKHLKVHT